ncbi:MAG TPA: aminoacetone oxidase family FAD-binding enzyme, partial [Victivallales bacterium]|nr:aminoacetone oxidase family FAD-binding enzyme [Victivallales bacterium]
DGDGYKLAKFAGHSIIRPLPALVELYCQEKWPCSLAGVSVKDLEIRVANNKAIRERGEFLFTHNGISGPVVLDISGEVAELLDRNGETRLLLNFLPKFTQGEMIAKFMEWRQKAGKKKVLSLIANLFPSSLAEVICRNSTILDVEFSQLDLNRQNILLKNLFETSIKIYDTAGFKRAMLTKGGISLKEVNPKTLESRIIRGLFFTGEILDLQGKCGGYNLQWAFSSARLAVESLRL